MRLRFADTWRRWPTWGLAIAWALLLALLPWWIGLPLLLALAVTQAARVPRLLSLSDAIRRALRWGLAGLLVASYRAFDSRALAPTFTLLAALVGFSLLMLLEWWQRRDSVRSIATAASSPEWRELALAPIGPSATLIELQAPVWRTLSAASTDASLDAVMVAERSCLIEKNIRIDDVEAQLSAAPGQRWFALPIAAKGGVVLYDRSHCKQHRLRGWQLYGWHADEAWLSRGDDRAPVALSHVLGHDLEE